MTSLSPTKSNKFPFHNILTSNVRIFACRKLLGSHVGHVCAQFAANCAIAQQSTADAQLITQINNFRDLLTTRSWFVALSSLPVDGVHELGFVAVLAVVSLNICARWNRVYGWSVPWNERKTFRCLSGGFFVNFFLLALLDKRARMRKEFLIAIRLRYTTDWKNFPADSSF